MKITCFVTILFLLYSCATVDLPPGGDVDKQAPIVLSSFPDSAQVNVSGNQLHLTFDEYFTTDNLSSNLLISPPFEKAITSKVKGKTLTIYLPNNLKDSTTYQFFFGNTIADLNEGNKTSNLRLVFSTGPSIDSATLTGRVVNAFSSEPEKERKVFLYKTLRDSQLMLNPPYYVTLTDKTGSFSFQNISNQDYIIYALNDKNNNNRLDKDEEVAFLTHYVSADSTAEDLLFSTPIHDVTLKTTSLTQTSSAGFKLVFNKPLHISPTVLSGNIDASSISKTNTYPWYFGETTDTIYLFVPLPTLQNHDSLLLDIRVDSVQLNSKISLEDVDSDPPHVELMHSLISPNDPITLLTNYPVRKTTTEHFLLFNTNDSIPVVIDSVLLSKTNHIQLFSKLKEDKKYSLILNDDAIKLLNEKNNTIDTFLFATHSTTQTGQLEMGVSFDSSFQKEGNYFLILPGTNKSKTTEPILISNDTVITFNYLAPDKYLPYIFEDLDGDENWSGSNYIKNTLPERIWRINSPIEVRANWNTKDILLSIE